MEELLKFDEESWNSLFHMVTSKDEESRHLAFGMLENIDYNDQEQMEKFEENMQLSMGSLNMPTNDKGKIIHHYFTALSKQNGNI